MIIVILGVTGSGKSTIGALLAQRLGWQFADADNFHPPANIAKMAQGIPLDDEDRWPWLDALHAAICQWRASGQNFVLACSALKQSYRDRLGAETTIRWVYLKGTLELFRERLRHRHGHFAGEGILAGQFRDLEEPRNALVVDAGGAPSEIVAEIRAALGLSPSAPA